MVSCRATRGSEYVWQPRRRPPPTKRSPQRNRLRLSDMNMLSIDLGNRYMSVSDPRAILGSLLTDYSRRDSGLLTKEDPNNVISPMQNSMWGGKLLQVSGGSHPAPNIMLQAEEDER